MVGTSVRRMVKSPNTAGQRPDFSILAAASPASFTLRSFRRVIKKTSPAPVQMALSAATLKGREPDFRSVALLDIEVDTKSITCPTHSGQ